MNHKMYTHAVEGVKRGGCLKANVFMKTVSEAKLGFPQNYEKHLC